MRCLREGGGQLVGGVLVVGGVRGKVLWGGGGGTVKRNCFVPLSASILAVNCSCDHADHGSSLVVVYSVEELFDGACKRSQWL